MDCDLEIVIMEIPLRAEGKVNFVFRLTEKNVL